MTISDLQHLQRYTRWANNLILEELLRLGQPPIKAIKLMAHILAAEHLWLDRMTNESRNHLVWPDWGVYDCDEQQRELDKRWKKFFDSLSEEGLDRKVEYINSQGSTFTSTVREILTHLALHAPHHRGQINMELHAEGYQPPYVDYIQAVRTKQIT
jgi:uncharacterized damage-inducible protein DinB